MELQDFQILSVSHQNLDVEDVGQFVIPTSDNATIVSILEKVKIECQLSELMYLSTCNRVSFFFVSETTFDKNQIQSFFRRINPNLSAAALINIDNYIKHYSGIEAVHHTFKLSSSLDSLVVGEREIFRQFREAYNFSLEHNLSGDFLRLLEKYTVQAAKYVYANTKIGEKPVSVVSLAIQKLRLSDLPLDGKILLIGAGETNRLVGKFLKKFDYSNTVIFNRTIDNAKELSTMLDAPAFHINTLSSYNDGFDAIIICTGATQSLIDKDVYRKLLCGDTAEKLIIDLSVPRNVDKDVCLEFKVNYIGVGHLKDLAEENMKFRKEEVKEATVLLDKKLSDFKLIFKQRQLEKSLQNVPKEIRSIKTRALEKVFVDKIKELEPSNQKLIIEMMDYMEKKCVAVPIKLAKEKIK